MRRMYGDFQMTTEYGPPLQQSNKRKRDASKSDYLPGVPDVFGSMDDIPSPVEEKTAGDSYFSKWRSKRQANLKNNRNQNQGNARPNVGPNPSTEPTSGRYINCFFFLLNS